MQNGFCCDAEHEWTFAATTGRVFWKVTKGVLSVHFRKDGGLISSGRDNRVKGWKTSGDQTNSLILEEGIPIQATVDYSGKKVIIGDTLGNIKGGHN